MSTPTAIVVGAGTGLGQAVALNLHRAGLTVVAVDRSEGGLQQLPDEIHREVADATDPAIPGPLVDRIAAEVGPPDILVNTIGTFELGDALTVTPQILRHLMDVNLGAALWLTQAVAPHMQDSGLGRHRPCHGSTRSRPDRRLRRLWAEQGRPGAPGPYPRR